MGSFRKTRVCKGRTRPVRGDNKVYYQVDKASVGSPLGNSSPDLGRQPLCQWNESDVPFLSEYPPQASCIREAERGGYKGGSTILTIFHIALPLAPYSVSLTSPPLKPPLWGSLKRACYFRNIKVRTTTASMPTVPKLTLRPPLKQPT